MTLLKELQNALNSVYGNSLLIEDDRKYDEYFCVVCKGRVSEDRYNHKMKCCYDCWFKEE